MKIYAKIILLVSILILCPFRAYAEDLTHVDLMTTILNSTVLIKVEKDNVVIGSGSGVIISADGKILTNYHVVHNSDRIRVWLHKDRRRHYHVATVLGIDPVSDLAVLDIDPRSDEKFVHANLELDRTKTIVGIDVYAVGAPLSLYWSVTKGVINSINRPSFLTPYVYLIQHDAVIQEGSSGGPLFNVHGNVVGINTYVIAPSRGTVQKVQIYSGMGYAVQINEVANSLRWMMQGLEVPRAAMKLNVINLTEDVRRYILKEEGRDIPNTFGIIINFLKEDDYGSKQGLLNLDVIVAMDGFPINDMQDAATYMANKKPYEIVYLMIIRDGEFKLLSYKLDKLEIPMKFYDKDDVSRSPSNTEEEDEEELEELEELSPLDELELEEEDK
jgi:serine protease Do